VSGVRGDWSSAPAREPGHVDETAVGREARPASAAPAVGRGDGRVHGTPAPEYGEYAPAGWVNPVLVEQERRDREQRERERREQSGPGQPSDAARRAAGAPPDRARPTTGAAADGTPAPRSRYGASPLDFVVTVGLLVMGLTSTVQSLQVGQAASGARRVFESQGADIADPTPFSTAAVVAALVSMVVLVVVTWWSVHRLRARRWTFWVPLLGGLVTTVCTLVLFTVALLHGQDPR